MSTVVTSPNTTCSKERCRLFLYCAKPMQLFVSMHSSLASLKSLEQPAAAKNFPPVTREGGTYALGFSR